MKDYDKIFNQDVNIKYFYNADSYNGAKLVEGKISLKNALERLKLGEYYTLVTYEEGETLPEAYVQVNVETGNSKLLATVNPKLRFNFICMDGGIQMISKLSDDVYLLGPGPEKYSMSSKLNEQINFYLSNLEESNNKSM